MSETLVRMTESASFEVDCSRQWEIVVEDASSNAPPYYYRCKLHDNAFSLMESCRYAQQRYARGEVVSLSSDKAAGLVKRGLAAYPTHTPEVDESVQSTLDRTNAVMEEMGLPSMDADSLRVISMKGAAGKKHYQRRGDTSLASDLGISAEEISEIRNLASDR